jgi:hypothetical protein
VTELLTGILVVVTVIYAWSTYRIQKANEAVVVLMHRQAEETSRPYVSISIFMLPHNPIFYLRISNLGRSAATDLRLVLDRSFIQFGEPGPDRDLAGYRAFQEPIDSFAPSTELIFPLAQSFVVFSDSADPARTPAVFNITATYSFGGKVFTEKSCMDLRPYFMSSIPLDATLSEYERQSKALEEIAKAARALAAKQALRQA